MNQTLADLVKIRNLRVARENVKASELTAKDARDLIVMAVGGSYLQAGASAARVNVARAQVETAEAVYKQAADRNIAGLNARIDANRSRVELQTQQQRLRSLQADYDKQKLTLARIIGLPLAQEFSLADDFPFQSLEGMTQEQAIERALTNRADLQAAQAHGPRCGDGSQSRSRRAISPPSVSAPITASSARILPNRTEHSRSPAQSTSQSSRELVSRATFFKPMPRFSSARPNLKTCADASITISVTPLSICTRLRTRSPSPKTM